MENKYNLGDAVALALSNGSTWATKERMDAAIKRLGITWKGMDDLIMNRRIIYYDNDGSDLFTLPACQRAEHSLAENLMRIRNAKPAFPIPSDEKIQEYLDQAAKETGVKLCDEQAEAVAMAAKTQVLIVTGGPGTGKTSTLKSIEYVLRKIGYTSIAYTAPTGKAARRISESTGQPASTLHKKIKITKDNLNPTKIEEQVVIVDEVSMLDLQVSEAFFRAVPSGTKVILVGDTDQLPSVGNGSVLRDMIRSEVVPVAYLIKTFRQGAESLIISNMKNVRDGICDLRNGDDFHLMSPNKIYSAVDEMLAVYMSEYERLGGNDDLVLLTPFRKRTKETSSEALNDKLQAMINPTGKYCRDEKNNLIFRIGDPVMQMENRAECANGDVGRIIDAGKNGIVVQYIDGQVQYTKTELSDGQLSLAYAMSIHKSQGSEYKSVITCLLNEHGPMLQRNLLYTAVTRAKKNCFLVCEPDAVKKAIETVADSNRVTLLAEMLRVHALLAYV